MTEIKNPMMRKLLGLLGGIALPAQAYAHGITNAGLILAAELIAVVLMLVVIVVTERRFSRGLLLAMTFCLSSVLSMVIWAVVLGMFVDSEKMYQMGYGIVVSVSLIVSAVYTFKLKRSNWRRHAEAKPMEAE